MLWFITQVRRQALRGIEKITVPLLRNDQGCCRSASLVEASAARASATFLSKACSNSWRFFGSGGGWNGLPSGHMSNESLLMVSTTHPGMFAKWPASQIMLPDFSWGFQESFSSGTRSRVLRVLAISWPKSKRSDWLSDIGDCSLLKLTSRDSLYANTKRTSMTSP